LNGIGGNNVTLDINGDGNINNADLEIVIDLIGTTVD
jgi:hypothetical protein